MLYKKGYIIYIAFLYSVIIHMYTANVTYIYNWM